ncbi:MAG: PilZ domain-containing protein [Nitrospinae bacterium]|nr:PilZ domain-containing protein [Nitrospinota bacterium]
MMDNIFFKKGLDIFVRIGDIGFKGNISSIDESSKRIDIGVPDQWLSSLARVERGSECTITTKSHAGQNYVVGLSKVIEKRLNFSPPLLIIDFPEKFEKRSELRRYRRIGVSIITGIYQEKELKGGNLIEKHLEGTIVDIGLGGCQIMVDYLFETGELLLLDLNIGGNGGNLRIPCQVRYTKPFYNTRLKLYGLEFVNMGKEIKDKLESFITNLI